MRVCIYYTYIVYTCFYILQHTGAMGFNRGLCTFYIYYIDTINKHWKSTSRVYVTVTYLYLGCMRARNRNRYNNIYYYVGYSIVIHIIQAIMENKFVGLQSYRVRLIKIEKFHAIIRSRCYRYIAVCKQASFGFIDFHFHRYGGICVYVLFTLNNSIYEQKGQINIKLHKIITITFRNETRLHLLYTPHDRYQHIILYYYIRQNMYFNFQ